MKYVFIYGPPAVGKLTIAKELSKLVRFKILHNHLAADFVGSLLEWNSKDFRKYIHKFRLELIDAACKNNIDGIIQTFVYAKNSDDEQRARDIMKVVKKNNGEFCFIHITASNDALERRVTGKSRIFHRKIKDKNTLRKIFSMDDYFQEFSFIESFKIDNTKLSPKKVALMIIKKFNLRKNGK